MAPGNLLSLLFLILTVGLIKWGGRLNKGCDFAVEQRDRVTTK